MAARQRGLLPREMQSITWEAVRSLFNDNWKSRGNKNLVNSIWKDYANGNETIDSARQKIASLAGGFKAPDWLSTPASGGSLPSGRGAGDGGSPRDPGELFGFGFRRPNIPADRRGRSYDPEVLAREIESMRFMPDASMPNVETLQGYRIVAGKNFRVYSPVGALIGIFAQQEKARRLVFKKLKVSS